MAYIIAIAGKGGVGKTTIAALLVRHLKETGGPVLAVDADPNSNLNTLLGFEYKDTISDIREEAKTSSSASFSKSDLFNMRLQEIIVEGDSVDLLVMGRPEGAGCYCEVNNILREHLSKLSKNYKFVVIDNEAGMEHLSRRTAGSIDNLLLVSDTTAVGVRSAVNAFRTVKLAGLKVKDVSLLINRSSGAANGLGEDKLKLVKEAGLKIAGYIPFYEAIQKSSENGNQAPDIKINDWVNAFPFPALSRY